MSQPLIFISRKQALWFAFYLVLYEFLTYIANDMIMPGMLQVVKTFHGAETDIAASLSLYILGGATLQIFLGPLSDRYGRRPVMMTGAWLFLLFTLFIALSLTMGQFLWARFFQGMGLCFISVVGYATLQEIFHEMDAIRLMAMMANISISAPLLGPLLGAVSAHYLSWRFVFFIIAFFSALALWGLWRYMPESVGQKKRDGTVIPRAGLSFQEIFKNYLTLLKNPVFLTASIASGLAGLPCVAWIGLSPIILVTMEHQSLIQYGLWQLPIFGALILGNMVLHRMTHHYPIKTLLQIGSFIMSIGLSLMWMVMAFGLTHFMVLILGFVVYSLGLGIIGSPLSRFILFSTSVVKGTASALMSMIIMGIQAIGVQWINLLYSDHNNQLFAFSCVITIGMYAVMIFLSFKCSKISLDFPKET